MTYFEFNAGQVLSPLKDFFDIAFDSFLGTIVFVLMTLLMLLGSADIVDFFTAPDDTVPDDNVQGRCNYRDVWKHDKPWKGWAACYGLPRYIAKLFDDSID